MRAIQRRASVIAMTAILAAMPVGLVAAQGETDEPAATPTPFCGVLTDQEASAALGVTLTVGTSSLSDCSYDADMVTSGLSLIVSRADGPLSGDPEADYPDGSTLSIAGHDAYFAAAGPILYVDEGSDGQLFVLQLIGDPPDAVDVQAALTSLAATALPRLPSIPLPPGPSAYPTASYLGDAELAALIPSQVDGVPLEIVTRSGADILAGGDPTDTENQDFVAQLQAIVATAGKTMDDLAIGSGSFSTDDAYGTIVAVRIKGADIAGVADALLPVILSEVLDPQEATVSIAGRSVIQVTDGLLASPGASIDPLDVAAYMYPSGDVLWFVSAVEPALSGIFQQLP